MAMAGVMMAISAAAAPSVHPTGVTRYEPDRAWNGYTLFTGQDKKTHLIDMNGNEVKQWPYEGFPPVLLDPALTKGKKGNVLLQLAQLPGVQAAGNGLGNKSIGEVDWNGNVLWQWGAGSQDAYASASVDTAGAPGGAAKQHHDWRRLANGNTLVLANKVHAVPGFAAKALLDDVIYEVTPDGRIAWQWTASEHLDEFGFSPAALKLVRAAQPKYGAQAVDWLHINDMAVVGPNRWHRGINGEPGDDRFHPDNIVIDSREANFIAIIDRKTGKVVWSLGPDFPAIAGTKVPRPVDQLIGQHDAHIIPEGLPGAGNLLVFDNQGEAGYPKVSPGIFPHSRVLEIDPVKKEIVWQYTAVDSRQPAWSFYSAFISSARRLPNGNTLIDEGMNGRFFQVTQKGDIVWEYVSPYYGASAVGGNGKQVDTNWVYRAQPVPYEWVPEGTPRAEQAVPVPAPPVARR
ncbi:ArsR family transcriptional regulator [Massilia dura]|uniref:ArsR family transcriptional regulator n=2 Tax=Pseudoduganella dura TaxID=321982 RepID=A0A6I3XAZ8_9BURK|nr:ArsR family transcriptional regulator [Pseudoduganella dura]